MGARGRKSSSDLAVRQNTDKQERLSPPLALTPEQCDVWERIVDAMPADWFGKETMELLGQYCRHTVAANRVSQLIDQHEQSDEFSVEEYDRLLKMQEREGRAMSSLATRMRLTQHARKDTRVAGRATRHTGDRPWEV